MNTTLVPALADGMFAINSGAPGDLWGGRPVSVNLGLDIAPNRMRGLGRMPGKNAGFRPGAYTPKTIRVPVDVYASSNVGSEIRKNLLQKLQRGFTDRGPTGSRVSWESSHPRHSGLNPRSRLGFLDTPAAGVYYSSRDMIGSGGMVLGPSFASPDGMTPSLPRAFDPVPAPSSPVGYSVAPSPVGVLPGTPGYKPFAPGDQIDPGLFSWGAAQQQTRIAAPRIEESPVVDPGMQFSPLPGEYQPIVLPISHPGTEHIVPRDPNEVAYMNQPDYPRYTSPFGYEGGTRVSQESPLASGHDVVSDEVAVSAKESRTRFLLGASILGSIGIAFLISGRRKKRRK